MCWVVQVEKGLYKSDNIFKLCRLSRTSVRIVILQPAPVQKMNLHKQLLEDSKSSESFIPNFVAFSEM